MDSHISKMDPSLTIKESFSIQIEEQKTALTMISFGTSIPLDTDQRSLEMSTMKIHFSLTLRINMKMMTSTMNMMKCIRSF